MIAEKKGQDYSQMLRWLRCRLNFALLLRSSITCLRGTRSKNVPPPMMSPHPTWYCRKLGSVLSPKSAFLIYSLSLTMSSTIIHIWLSAMLSQIFYALRIIVWLKSHIVQYSHSLHLSQASHFKGLHFALSYVTPLSGSHMHIVGYRHDSGIYHSELRWFLKFSSLNFLFSQDSDQFGHCTDTVLNLCFMPFLLIQHHSSSGTINRMHVRSFTIYTVYI